MTMSYGGHEGLTVLVEPGDDAWTFEVVENKDIHMQERHVYGYKRVEPAPTWKEAEEIAGQMLDDAL